MKSTLVLFSLFLTGLRAAPREGIVPHVINGTPQIVQHAAAVVAVLAAPATSTFGGGSIISDRHILTGANLIFGAIECRVGYGSTTIAGLQIVPTTTFVSHSGFNRTTLENDIAIIFLPFASRIVFSDAVRAIALPTAAPTVPLEGSLGGFGYTSSNAPGFSDTLMVANLVTADNAVCTARFPSIIFDTHFCANGGPAVIPGLISNICGGDNGAGFYTGDGMITTTTTTEAPTEDTTTESVLVEATTETGVQTENNANSSNEILEFGTANDNDGSVTEDQVEPTLVGIASVIGNFWECNPADPRGYTIVFNYIQWIQDLTGIEV